MLHHEIVAMCVDADVVVEGEGILQGGVHDARCFARTGDAVDSGVWFVVGPFAVVDDVLGRVGAATQYESSHYSVSFHDNVAVSAVNVFL